MNYLLSGQANKEKRLICATIGCFTTTGCYAVFSTKSSEINGLKDKSGQF
jgi:hypothetical protein